MYYKYNYNYNYNTQMEIVTIEQEELLYETERRVRGLERQLDFSRDENSRLERALRFINEQIQLSANRDSNVWRYGVNGIRGIKKSMNSAPEP